MVTLYNSSWHSP